MGTNKMSEDLLRKISSNWVHADSVQARDMASECVEHRLLLQRLEKWAEHLAGDPSLCQRGDVIAAELRALMKG